MMSTRLDMTADKGSPQKQRYGSLDNANNPRGKLRVIAVIFGENLTLLLGRSFRKVAHNASFGATP